MNLQADYVRVVSSFAWIIFEYIALANVWVGQDESASKKKIARPEAKSRH